MSLRSRLLALLISAALAVTLTATGATYFWARHEIDRLFDYQLTQHALALQGSVSVLGSISVEPPDPEQHLVVQLWDLRGDLRYVSHPSVRFDRPGQTGFANVERDGRDWRVYTRRIGPWVVQLGHPLDIRRRIATAAALRILYPTLAVVPLLALAIWWLVGRALSPLTRLAASIAERDPLALEPFGEPRLPREAALMVDALNQLVARLREVLARQKQFMADAAHELRSPLTAVRLQSQLLERATEPAQRAAALAELKAGIARSTHLVERLLTLARLDPEAPARHGTGTVVDLARLAAIVADEFVAEAAAAGITLGVEAPAAAAVPGNEENLRSLLVNLIDNALRYTPRGGRVEVTVSDDGGRIVLTVADTGPGIPSPERERVFDRFYRIEGTGVPGSGLGLAIAKRVAELHGGTVSVTEGLRGGGTAIVVNLPAA